MRYINLFDTSNIGCIAADTSRYSDTYFYSPAHRAFYRDTSDTSDTSRYIAIQRYSDTPRYIVSDVSPSLSLRDASSP